MRQYPVPQGKGTSQLRRRVGKGLRFTITGLLLLVWLSGVMVFIIYSQLPAIQEHRMSIIKHNPYTVAYSLTTQIYVTISPPHDYVLGSTEDGKSVTEQTIEYVNPSGVVLSNLENNHTEIIIPSVQIRGWVVDGYSQEEMLRGFWHYPDSSIPGKRGNTVIFGHRYHRLPPMSDTFFNLDKVNVGDNIIVSDDNTELTYTVVVKKVIDKYDNTIVAPTGDYRLTLVTCTPLWTAEKRLVVIAIQDRVSSVI